MNEGIRFGDLRLPQTFWAQVSPDPAEGCWRWTGHLDPMGYGRRCGKPEDFAHRRSFSTLVGPIPKGMQLDHLCHTRAVGTCPGGRDCIHRRCVNPAHLEVVTRRENLLRGTSPMAMQARQTHCQYGHPFSPENTYVDKRGYRLCRVCRRMDAWIRRGTAELHREEIAIIKAGGGLDLPVRENDRLHPWLPKECPHCGHVGRFRHDYRECVECGDHFCIQIGRPRVTCRRCVDRARRAS